MNDKPKVYYNVTAHYRDMDGKIESRWVGDLSNVEEAKLLARVVFRNEVARTDTTDARWKIEEVTCFTNYGHPVSRGSGDTEAAAAARVARGAMIVQRVIYDLEQRKKENGNG